MADAKRSHDWDLTCSTIATLININRGKNSRPCNPNDLHPMRDEEAALVDKLKRLMPNGQR